MAKPIQYSKVKKKKETACNAGNPGSIPGLRRPPGEGNGYPLQYSGLEDSIDRGVQEVTKSQTRLSDFHFHFQKLETNVNHKVFIKAIKVAQMVKNLSAKQNSLVQSLGREDPL